MFLDGAHEGAKLQELLDAFIRKFVLCPECDNPETVLVCRVWYQFSDAINNRTRSQSLCFRSSILSPHVNHCYARLCRAINLERPFLSGVMSRNLK